MFHCSVIKDRFCIAVCLKQLCYYIMSFPACQELFSTFLKLFLFLSCSNFGSISCLPLSCQELFSRNFSVFAERRRRDLNPRAATNDLLPFQGSPFGQLGYFSKLPYLLSSSDIYLCRSQRQVILYLVSFMLSSTFLTFLKSFYSVFDKRREWDSNPRALADKRFSRPPRYDHFDTSPYLCSGLRFRLARRQVIFYHLFFNMSIYFFHFFYFFLSYVSRANISPISRSSGVVIFIFL